MRSCVGQRRDQEPWVRYLGGVGRLEGGRGGEGGKGRGEGGTYNMQYALFQPRPLET